MASLQLPKQVRALLPTAQQLASTSHRSPAYNPHGVRSPQAVAAVAPCANPGKDGNPAALSGVVNTYFAGTGSAAAGATSVSVAASSAGTTGIAVGDLLLVIQMQGADFTTTNSNAYGANNATGTGYSTGTTLTAGQYEYVVANSALATGTAGTISIGSALVNSYSTAAATTAAGRRSFQVIRVPQYGNVTLGGQVTAAAWDGNAGGLLVMDVAGTLNLNGQTLNAAGLGFRGGGGKQYTGSAATGLARTDYRTSNSLNTSGTTGANASKGEGIAGTPRYTQATPTAGVVDNSTNSAAFGATAVTDGYPTGDNGRGGPGNAGGGATDGTPSSNGLNSGGAGGGNGGTGGVGGWPRATTGLNPTVYTDNQAVGGAVFSQATASRLVMGGGGGAGTNNNNAVTVYSSGAAGGGIIIVRTGAVSGAGTADASGDGGYVLDASTVSGVTVNEGAGGGGAGGTVLITSNTPAGLANLTVRANGGKGNSNSNPKDVAHGPGGGGGGGFIFTNGAVAATSVTGGVAGTTTCSNTNYTGTTYGAAAGNDGAATTNIGTSIDNSVAGANCPVPDLATTISGPAQAVAGQTVYYYATTTNVGTNAAGSVITTIALPGKPAASTVSVPNGTYDASTGIVTFATVSSLAVNASSTNYVSFVVPAGVTSATGKAASTTSGSGYDYNTSNNDGSATAANVTTITTATGASGTAANCATAGKDGSATLTTNPVTYYPSTAAQTLAAGSTSVQVGAATGAATNIQSGDLLLIIQMQGADFDYTDNTDSYGDGVAGPSGNGNYNTGNFTAGQYEYVTAASAVTASTGGTITLATGLKNSYASAVATTTTGQRSFQVIRVPQYATLTLGATITPAPWNGSTGGVIVLDVAGALNFNGNTVDASGLGFRGGAGRQRTGSTNATAIDYRSTANRMAHGTKGEGTAGTPRYLNDPAYTSANGVLLDTRTATTGYPTLLPSTLNDGYPSGDNARGAPGNAGGGGTDSNPATNSQNSGGAGGANGGRGGRGGNAWSSGAAVGGEPGAAFPVASSSRLVLGGGGGAGSTNDGTGTPGSGFASSGAAGGGIVLMRTGSVSGTGSILANGASANNSVANDGSGGGGAGGSVLLTATNSTAGLANITVSTQGGTGGSNRPGNGATAHGPGGGGGGGIILANGAINSASSAAAGANGTTYSDGTSVVVAFGAEGGTTGVSNTSISNTIANSTAGANCIADVATTITGPTTANAGQPTGTFTATFANNGAVAASSVTQTVTLPTGAGLTAAQKQDLITRYGLTASSFVTTGSGTSAVTTINFGTVTSLASGTSNSYTFAYTAPTTAGSYSTTSNTSTTTGEGGLTANNSASTSTTVATDADVTVSLAGPATLNAGQPTGTFTATFTNEGVGTAAAVTRAITLPTGASLTDVQKQDLITRYSLTAGSFSTTGSGTSAVTTINFGAVNSLAAYASSSVTFAFTAPTTVSSSLTLTGATSTTTSEGSNIAPNQSALTLSTVATADVTAAITGSTTISNGTATGTFNVTFGNNGPQTAAGLVPTVQLPAGLTGVTVPSGWTYTQNTGVVSYNTTGATLASGSTLGLTISFTVPSGSPVTATATISTTTNEAGLTANNAATATLSSAYDLATTISGPASTTSTIAGSPTTLYVTTANNGPNAAPTAVQTVTIPSDAALTNVFVTNGGTYSYNASSKVGTVTFPALTNLPSGQTVTNSISFNAPTGNFTASALVTPNSTTAGDTNTNNNTASTSVTVTNATATTTNEATTITATVGSTATPATVVDAGTVVTYTVKAVNNGPAATTNVVQQVQLLPGLTTSNLKVGGVTGTSLNGTISFTTTGGVTTYNPSTGVLTYYTVANQASGTDATITYPVLAVTTPATVGNGGQLLATASVSTALSDPVPADNTASVAVKVRTTDDLATTVAGPSATTAGMPATYTVTFTNKGASDATTVAETAQLPVGLSSVTITDASGNVVSGASYNSATGLLTFPTVANMPSGASQVYSVAFTAPGQDYSVSSTVTSGTSDAVGTNNSAAVRTTVSPNSDVAINVSGPVTALVGNPVTYAVTTTNNGPSPATGVVPTLQLPAGLSGVSVTGGTYSNTSGLVTFATTSLAPGQSQVTQVTFTMPSPSSGYVTGAATVSSTSTDAVSGNNTSSVTTSVAPATPDQVDLLTTITPSATSVTAGSTLTYTVRYTNASTTTAAANVMPTAYLPAGLSGVVIKDGSGNAVSGASYNSTTGLVTFPTIASQAANTTTTYTVALTVPGGNGAGSTSTTLVASSAVASATSESVLANNEADAAAVTITSAYDVVTALGGPTTALPGSTNTYTVTTLNNGPSTATTTTTQTVTGLPTGLTASTLQVDGLTGTGTGTITFKNSAGTTVATYSGSTLTLADVANLPAGAANAVTHSFAFAMPTSGSVSLRATVASANESNKDNNNAPLTTTQANLAPVAQNVWNTLQSARGNTATTGLAISSLNATDSDGSIANYYVQSLPASGTLYYNGTAISSIPTGGYQVADPSKLSYTPTSGFVGNAFFTYTATDNSGAVSNTALYTIPVAQDQSTTYTAYNSAKGGSNVYNTGDVLAQLIDPNTAVYTSAGTIYNASTGVLLSGASNGLGTTGTNAVLASTGPSQNTSNTLPTGVSLDAATGRIYVSDASKLPSITAATTYYVNVVTTDLNGGTNTALAAFTIGANPLPVELVAFTAQAVQNRDALLTWTTASELRNDHFEVERSVDGVSFSKVGQVAGQGSKSSSTSYRFTDASASARAAAGQPVYYRLKQVDTDGTSAYSPVRTVSFTAGATATVTLFPNPAAAATSLDLSALPAAGTYQVQVLDVTGRQVHQATLAGGLVQALDVHELASGTYQVLVTGQQADGSALRQVLRLTKE